MKEALKSIKVPIWSILIPLVSVLLLFVQGSLPNNLYTDLLLGAFLIGSVLASVSHAETVAHRVGEPYGTIILALAITVIEVSLIVSIMLSEGNSEPSFLARDTVFAAIMIILTGIIGICFLSGGYRFKEQNFIKQGISTGLITLLAIATLTLILPNHTTSQLGNSYTSNQLFFVAIVSLILYGGFLSVQTIRHRNYFVLEEDLKTPNSKTKATKQTMDQDVENNVDQDSEDNIDHTTVNIPTTIVAFVMLLVALAAVVLLSKLLSPTIESAVAQAGAPKSLVGIIIATVILLPEGLAAYKAARQDRLQTSLNLAIGSALASIGLTIPAVAIVSYFTGLTVALGIDAKSTVLLLTSIATVYLSISSGRTNIQQGIVLLVLFATYLFTTIAP
ncbi:calcium:cation antiporter [Myroides sp. LJL115]